MAAEPIQGFAELQKKLAAMGQAAGTKALRDATLQATLPAMQAIRARVPVGTRAHFTYKGRYVSAGFLQSSIKRKSFILKDKSGAVAVIGMAAEAFYGGFIELGTSKMARRPFLEPGFRSAQPAMIARLRERLGRAIDRAAQSGNA